MKKIILAAMAFAAFTACVKEEVVTVNQETIAFENAFVDNATKSVVDPSFTNTNLFTDFAVYGFVEGAVLFNGTQVSKSITNADLTKSTWKYAGTQYWIAGANYNFAAVAPKTSGGWEKETSTVDMPGYTVTTNLSFTNDGTKDLLYADAGKILGKDSGNGTVAFTFRHVLSKVKFSFENAYNASAATIKVYDIEIKNAYTTGNVALTSASTAWSGQAGTLVLDFGAAVNEGVDDDDDVDEVQIYNTADAFAYNTTLESYNELLLIPGAVTDGYNVTFKVDLLVSDQKIKTYEHTAKVNFAPAPGTCYDIKAVINAENIDPDQAQEPIEFSVTTINGWENPADGDDQDNDPDQPNAEI